MTSVDTAAAVLVGLPEVTAAVAAAIPAEEPAVLSLTQAGAVEAHTTQELTKRIQQVFKQVMDWLL
jgi:hypothetical protein